MTPRQTSDAVREAIIEQAHAAVRDGDYRMGYLRMCEAYGKLAALGSRAVDAGEVEHLEGCEHSRCPIRICNCPTTPAPAVDAVPAGEVAALASAVGYAGAVLRSHADKLPVPQHARNLADRCSEASNVLAALSHGEGRNG